MDTISVDVCPKLNLIVAASELFIAVWSYDQLKYEGNCRTKDFDYGIIKILDPLPFLIATSKDSLEIQFYYLLNRVSMKAFSSVGSLTLETKGTGSDFITSISYYISKSNQIFLFVGTHNGYVGVFNVSDFFIRNNLFKALQKENVKINNPL
jgi:hypothetical protein